MMKTREGHKKRMTVQVAKIRKPLISTVQLNEAGNDVNLHAIDPHVLHKASGEKTALRREGKSNIMDLWVLLPGKKNSGNSSGFTGPW